mmetsp:Transcript_4579/g.8688  ORF Transcript_4579/g.8688 Transcript_4579/m.8688 type:complete len:360 (+) Transcript_4579:213-1292(+)
MGRLSYRLQHYDNGTSTLVCPMCLETTAKGMTRAAVSLDGDAKKTIATTNKQHVIFDMKNFAPKENATSLTADHPHHDDFCNSTAPTTLSVHLDLSEEHEEESPEEEGCPIPSPAVYIEESSCETEHDEPDWASHGTLHPHGPTASILKPYENYSVSLKKRDWVILPPPVLDSLEEALGGGEGGMLRRRQKDLWTVAPPRDWILAKTSFSSPLPETATANVESGRSRNRVRFGAIQVRRYAQTVGDNPCVQYGPPISLDWTFQTEPTVSLDDYEVNRIATRGKPKTARRLVLNYYQRCDILKYVCGVSQDDMERAERAADRIKRQRSRTKVFMAFALLEEGCEAVAAKRNKKTRKLPTQ